MKRILSILTMACMGLVIYAGSAMASPLPDYSDATGYDNAVASAMEPIWQRLGKGDVTYESAPVANNGDYDNGVSWSINGGSYGNDVITVGDTVTFKFSVYKYFWGSHNTDWLKVWVDWNNDKDYTDNGENIYGAGWVFTPKGDTVADATKDFFYTMTFDAVSVGDYWLRARVVCNFDVATLSAVSSTGYTFQGEIEDWKLTVQDKQQVPEPASLMLFGFGLLGIAGLRRKIKK